jgi:hypothetical protein
LLPQHARVFEHRSRNEELSAARIFSSPILAEKFILISLIVEAVVRKCFAIMLAPVKGYFWRNASTCGPKVRVVVPRDKRHCMKDAQF